MSGARPWSPRAGILLAAALTLLAGCASVHPPGHPTRPTVAPPQPPGVQAPAQLPSRTAGPEPQCDPLASLRPPVPMPRAGAMPAGSTMARIVARGRLVVGVDQSSYLLAYRDPRSGTITGFDVDVAREVARAIFGDPDRIQLKPISDAQRIPVLQAGEVDLVADLMTITCERMQQISFSTNYFDSGQRLLVNRGSVIRGVDDLTGRRVCAVAGTGSLRTLAELASRPVPVAAESWTDCLVLLQQGQVEALTTEEALLIGLAAQDPGTEIVGPRFTEEPHGLALAQSAGDLVRFVNGVLDRIRGDGTWSAFYTRWFRTAAPPPPPARYRD